MIDGSQILRYDRPPVYARIDLYTALWWNVLKGDMAGHKYIIKVPGDSPREPAGCGSEDAVKDSNSVCNPKCAISRPASECISLVRR